MRIPGLFHQQWWPTFTSTLLCFVALIFLYDAWQGRFAMSEMVHGGAVYAIPAEAWSLTLLGVHGGFVWGLLVEGRKGALACLMSSGLGVLVYGAFFALATGAEFGGIVVYFSAFLFVPMQAVFLWQATVELLHDGT